MLDPLSASLGAGIAIAIREWFEYRTRRAEKIKNCYHEFFETDMDGWITKHCKKCPYQEPGGHKNDKR